MSIGPRVRSMLGPALKLGFASLLWRDGHCWPDGVLEKVGVVTSS